LFFGETVNASCGVGIVQKGNEEYAIHSCRADKALEIGVERIETSSSA